MISYDESKNKQFQYNSSILILWNSWNKLNRFFLISDLTRFPAQTSTPFVKRPACKPYARTGTSSCPRTLKRATRTTSRRTRRNTSSTNNLFFVFFLSNSFLKNCCDAENSLEFYVTMSLLKITRWRNKTVNLNFCFNHRTEGGECSTPNRLIVLGSEMHFGSVDSLTKESFLVDW